MVRTSLIKKVNKDNIERIILIGRNLEKLDADFLKQQFSLNSNQINELLGSYRNVGLVFKLQQDDIGMNLDWAPFINRIIIKNDIINKLDNVFINSDCNKVLLLTTKRLLKIDLDKLNSKIELINDAIHHYNTKIEKERRQIEQELDSNVL